MPDIELNFEYDFSSDVIYNWWTDLSGKGYIGKSLKAIEPFGKEGQKNLVKTIWKVMGFLCF